VSLPSELTTITPECCGRLARRSGPRMGGSRVGAEGLL
jgi:hypothetical protein